MDDADRQDQHIREVSLALAGRIGAECCPDPASAASRAGSARFDHQRAAALITDLVARLVASAVANEREECAQIAEVLEPARPTTIADVIRARGSTD